MTPEQIADVGALKILVSILLSDLANRSGDPSAALQRLSRIAHDAADVANITVDAGGAPEQVRTAIHHALDEMLLASHSPRRR